ncbi:hypothetical protein [Dankookia sp. P2]|uniref:hypothetical protein n=1 Tax=Dankookia sp. P2 TaxID=3423955 RepID=UPI003D6697D9
MRMDPAQGLDGIMDIAVQDGRIAAIGSAIAGPATEMADVSGKLVLPGMIDTHAHVFRYVTGRFGLDADMVGVRSGVTTLVDQGGPSVLTFPAFREYIVKPSASRACWPSSPPTWSAASRATTTPSSMAPTASRWRTRSVPARPMPTWCAA